MIWYCTSESRPASHQTQAVAIPEGYSASPHHVPHLITSIRDWASYIMYLTMPGHNQPCKLSTVTWKPLPHHHKLYISHECTVAQWTHTLHQMVLPANTMPNRVNWSTQAYDQPCYLTQGCSQTCGTLDWNDWLSHTTKKLPEISWDTILNDTDLYNY